MIPVEEFLEKQPEHQEDDEKTLMFARINHELAEREALEEQRQGLLKQKQTLMAENKKRKDDLASLDQDLEKFIDVSDYFDNALNTGAYEIQAAKPIQKIFEKQY